jgi:hypothetical protein
VAKAIKKVAKADKFAVHPVNPELVAQLPDDFQFAEDFCQRLEAVFAFDEANRIVSELGQKNRFKLLVE